jgi:flavin reductase (DIM6/NTAB) family NADH-FMN oxidoreductase RutF
VTVATDHDERRGAQIKDERSPMNTSTAPTNNNDDGLPWIELTEPKQFSRLLYTNPVCFLSTVSNDDNKRNVMVISWLSATNNEGRFMASMNKRRHTASVLLSGVSEFCLSVPVEGMETLVRGVGGISGQFGSKFPQDHVGQELPKELQQYGEDTTTSKRKRKRIMSAMGIPGLEAVPFGVPTSSKMRVDSQPQIQQTFAIRGTVAHLKCSIYKLMEGAVDDDHLLILARVNAACVHPSYWDPNKNRFRPAQDVPPYLTFFGAQEFGYVVTQSTETSSHESR